MQLLTRSRQNKLPGFQYVVVPVSVTIVLWWLSPYEISLLQAVVAFVLGSIPWASYCKWNQSEKQDLPLFVLIASMFWLAYVIPLFFSSHEISLTTGMYRLSDEAISKSLWLAVVGVLAIFAG